MTAMINQCNHAKV